MNRFGIRRLVIIVGCVLVCATASAAINISWNGAPLPYGSVVNINQGDTISFVIDDTSCSQGFFCSISFDFGGAGGYAGVYDPNTYERAGNFIAGYVAGDYTLTANGTTWATIHIPPIAVTVHPVGNVPQHAVVPVHASVNAADQSVTWWVSSAAGYVDTNSTGSYFHAGTTEGTYTITATSTRDTSKSNSAPLKILPPIQVSISPSTLTMPINNQQQFTATMTNSADTIVTWSVDGGGGGVIGDQGGSNGTFRANFVAEAGGEYHVRATSQVDPTKSAAADVEIVSVSVVPYYPLIEQGGSLQMRAVVQGSSQPVTWSTNAPGVSIDSAGYMTASPSAPVGTSYTVTATTVVQNPGDFVVSGSTPNLAVEKPEPPASVSIDPPSPTVAPGASATFIAKVYTSAKTPAVNQGVTWTATSPAAIDGSGRFTAPFTAGSYAVTAKSAVDPTKSATVTVSVPASIAIAPPFLSLAPGATGQLTASVKGLTSAINWAVRESGGGSVTSSGLYTAPSSPGTYHVLAAAAASPDLTATATISVTNSAAIFVDVSPDGVEMNRSGTQQFTAVVDGTPNQAVTWAASGGTIDSSTGSFTAPNAYGTVAITATSVADSRAVGSATVVVSDGSAGQAFTYDDNGNLLSDGVRTFEWDAENRLTAVTKGSHRSEFGYDGIGRRVLITEKDNGTVSSRKRYIWIGDSIVQELSSPAAAGFATASISTSTTVSAESAESVDLSGETSSDSKRSPQTTVSPTYQGSFDAADCSTLSGWAWDMNQPNTAINVDIYDNNTFLTSVPANIYNSALAGKGNGYHQFLWTVPASLKNGAAHALYVRYGGTYTALTNSPRSITCSAASYQGNLEVASCSSIDGWAWDSTQPNGTVNVDVLDGATVIGTVPANIFRQDLLNAGKGNGYHGFHLNPPSAVIDGKAHSISARVTGSTYTLVGTPKSITCTPPSTTPLAAKFVSQSVPTSMAPGGVYSVSITFQNTGTNAWTYANKYRLGDASAAPGTWNLSRVDLGSSDSIATGQSKTFTFNVLAPSTAGTYNFQWRMVEEFVAWFGDVSPNVSITVSGNPPRNATFVSQSVPTTVGAGESFPISVTMKNTGVNTWTAADSYRLGDQSPNSPAISWGRSRVDLSATDSIANGQTKTFTFTATAPSTAGTYKFQWRMVQESVAWFGDSTPAVIISVMPAVASATSTAEWVTASFYPGGMQKGGANYYFVSDARGSVRWVFDRTNALIAQYDYDPWGRLGYSASSIPLPPIFGFGGYFYHQPSALWLTEYRAYDPDLGRWLSPDPIEEDGGDNLYEYVENDPVNSIDPLGLQGGYDFCPVNTGGEPTPKKRPHRPHHPKKKHHAKPRKKEKPFVPRIDRGLCVDGQCIPIPEQPAPPPVPQPPTPPTGPFATGLPDYPYIWNLPGWADNPSLMPAPPSIGNNPKSPAQEAEEEREQRERLIAFCEMWSRHHTDIPYVCRSVLRYYNPEQHDEGVE